MLSRASAIHHKQSGVCLNTPLLVPSYSSRGFRLGKNGDSEIRQILAATAEFITESYLISAYDIHHGHLPSPDGLPCKPELIVVDSGGYEISNTRDFSSVMEEPPGQKPWSLAHFMAMLDDWPGEIPAVFVSYDHPKERRSLLQQVKAARALFQGRSQHLHALLIKPETDTQQTLDKSLRGAIASVEELSAFDLIGLTEKELGSSMLNRMVQIARLRTAMDEVGIRIPIHVFGSLDPVSTCLYCIAGAEVFDGLTWLRYGYSDDGRCVYRRNVMAMRYGIHQIDDSATSRAKMVVDNLYRLQKLQRDLQDFVSTGSFEKLGPHAKFFERARDSLNTKLRGGA